MEIREIEGKKFIEYDQHRKQKNKTIISILFLILMVLAITVLINTTLILVKNKDIIKSDPLIYGMAVHNFTSCQCSDTDGKTWFSKDTGFVYSPNSINTNYSKNGVVLNQRLINNG